MTSLLDDEDSDDNGRHQYDQHHDEAQRDDARLLGDRMTMRDCVEESRNLTKR